MLSWRRSACMGHQPPGSAPSRPAQPWLAAAVRALRCRAHVHEWAGSVEKDSAIERTGDVDPRVRHSKEVVMATTYELLSEEGLAGVTVDAVARRSGVAKTTIYRHWPSREALLLDACA